MTITWDNSGWAYEKGPCKVRRPEHDRPAPAPVAWRDHVEQRMRQWRQRTMNRNGDLLALDDFMDTNSLEDLIDYVCDEWSAPASVAQGESVAVIGSGYQLLWASGEPLADTVKRTGIKVGSVLYANAAPVPVAQPVMGLPADFLAHSLSRLTRERAGLEGFISIGNELHRAATYDRWISALKAAIEVSNQEGGAA